ncbi:CDP-alcohol phosphatidyltransferase family protein [Candidatus Kaiserbacteria bacterium]|nr:CDP-alcohol phosphatidyltransferase family protein [Candidatus Kaiserbacteria bacterium]
MESIKELRVMLQTNVLGHPILQRVLSIYLTRPLLSTSVTPNQVTVFMLLLGTAAAAAIFAGWFLTGLLLAYLNVLFDAVDGEVARYKKVYSQRGVYLDLINHLWTGAVIFLAVTLYAAGLPTDVQMPVLLVGILGALAMPVRRANGDLHRVMMVRKHLETAERPAPVQKKEQHTAAPEARFSPGFLRRLTQSVYDLHELAPMLIVLFLGAMAEQYLLPGRAGHPVLSWVVIFYGATSCLYLLREVVGGYYAIERRINSLAERL